MFDDIENYKMLLFSENSKNVAKYFDPVISGSFKWVNKIFWVAAISVGRSKRGKQTRY
jgi:hypothetical protein